MYVSYKQQWFCIILACENWNSCATVVGGRVHVRPQLNQCAQGSHPPLRNTQDPPFWEPFRPMFSRLGDKLIYFCFVQKQMIYLYPPIWIYRQQVECLQICMLYECVQSYFKIVKAFTPPFKGRLNSPTLHVLGNGWYVWYTQQ